MLSSVEDPKIGKAKGSSYIALCQNLTSGYSKLPKYSKKQISKKEQQAALNFCKLMRNLTKSQVNEAQRIVLRWQRSLEDENNESDGKESVDEQDLKKAQLVM
jgi:hypothetical protein